jgi:two-component system, cell cycle sensor histidine kinase and response regulator CckA
VALTAPGAAAGRELFRTHPEICCVLLDLTMPEGGGAPLVKEFHALRPTSPILLISGFAEPEITASMSGELSGFLAKPFTPKELKAALVRAVRPHQSRASLR